MYFLASFTFLLAFMAFAHGETCSQIMTCLNYAQNVQTAAQSGNMDEMCIIQKKMIDCFSSALADCESMGTSLPQESLNQFQTSMSEARKQFEKVCAGRGGSSSSGSEGNTAGGDGSMTYNAGSAGSVPETASCMDAAKCVFDIMELQSALNDHRIGKVCNILKPSAKCIKSALNDCKKSNLLPADQLQGMSAQVIEIETLIGQHCTGGVLVSPESSKGSTVDSSQSVSCTDAITCAPDSDKLVEAITNGQHDEACNIIRNSYNCMKAAIDDCKAKNLLSGEAIASMEEGYKAYEPQIAQYCQSPTGDVHCMESTTCIPDTDKLTDAITNGRFEEACQILTTSTNCLQAAVKDCKARGIMSEEDIKTMEELEKSYQPQIQQMCQQGATGGVNCFQMQSCMPDEAATISLNKSMENRQYEEACNLMKPAVECQLSALEDCKRRGAFDSESMKQAEESMASAKAEMDKYCSSGNSASTSMLEIFMAALFVFLLNFMNSKM